RRDRARICVKGKPRVEVLRNPGIQTEPTMTSLSRFIVVIVFLCFLPNSSAQEKDKTKYGWQPGESMRFHVVDFVAGVKKYGAGCPSIMTNNAKGVSVMIWTKSGGDAPFELAHAFADKLTADKKVQGFILSFGKATKEDLTAKTDKHGVAKFWVTIP